MRIAAELPPCAPALRRAGAVRRRHRCVGPPDHRRRAVQGRGRLHRAGPRAVRPRAGHADRDPSPPFKEKQRADAFLAMLRQRPVATSRWTPKATSWGCARAQRVAGPMLAVLAHLDTVFPEGTDVKVKRTATKLSAPGVGDDTRGLALMLAIVRAMERRQASDGERHPVCRQRRRGRRRRPARRQVPAAEGQVQGPDQAVHRDRRRRPVDRSPTAASAAGAIG